MTSRCLSVVLTIVVAVVLPGGTAAAVDRTPDPFICMYGHSDGPGVTAAFRRLIPRLTVIEGTSTDAAFIRELRARGCIYAAHVTNPTTATEEELVARWRAPFDRDLGGRLRGGYDAIAIDELRADADGSVQSRRVCRALAKLGQLYPATQIYAAATWQLGREASRHSELLRAAHEHADMLMLEVYLRETRPNYGYFADWADRLKAVEPGLLKKTVYGLGVSQRGYLHDDSTEVGFLGHLERQFRSIRTDNDAAKMPGVMFWVYYRSETDVTPEHLARLAEHYFISKKTGHLGDGTSRQLIRNAQFESLDGWKRRVGDGGAVERFDYDAIAGIQSDHDAHGWSSHGKHGLKMVRGSVPNRASFEVSGLDTRRVYNVSAWVMADRPGRRAGLRVIRSDGGVVAGKETDRAGRGTQWNEWSRITFNFRPTTPTVHVELHDASATPGTTLYWDFVEMESACAAK